MQARSELKYGLLKIIKPRLFADRVHRLVYNSTPNSFKQTFATLHCFSVVYLQHGGGNYCRYSDVTVNPSKRWRDQVCGVII